MKRAIDFDRPRFYQISEMPFPSFKEAKLSNDIPLYLITGGDQPIVKLEIVVAAGRPFEHRKLASTICSGLLKEGSKQFSGKDIAEKIDHIGATLAFPFSFDEISIQVHCLARHMSGIIPILSDLVINPVFPAEEINWFRQRASQRLAMDLAQNEIVAFRKATEIYFGPEHPYGYNSNTRLYEEVSRDDLLHHHHQTFAPGRIQIFVAGQPEGQLLRDLDQYFGLWKHNPTSIEPRLPEPDPPVLRYEEDQKKSQSAIRVGRRLFNSNHPDFPAILLLNTLLGGYFGSRLMKNIREDKGYTYGIHAGLETMRHDGYLSISLETDRRHVDKSLNEINREIDLLRTQPVPQDELQMVKNYISGHILSRMDGPVRSLGLIKKNILMGHKFDFTRRILHSIISLSAEEIQRMAIKYLDQDQMTTVIIH